MKEKLVEEWLIRARERAGIDQAYGQWLISQGHQILWLGHSRTEFGKDIISADRDGQFHAFQTKDEDIDLKELRRINDQITELVEVPIVHPRVPPGSPHLAHLVTSGLFKEEAIARIRAMNEGWAIKGRPVVEIIGRNDLIPRFVGMSDAFWPEKPADIRDFFLSISQTATATLIRKSLVQCFEGCFRLPTKLHGEKRNAWLPSVSCRIIC